MRTEYSSHRADVQPAWTPGAQKALLLSKIGSETDSDPSEAGLVQCRNVPHDGCLLSMGAMTFPSRLALMASAALGLAVLQPDQAGAHGVESSLRYLDGQLELTSSFSTGEPVQGAVVRLLQADGTPGKELGRIDEEGRLQVTLPELSDGLVDLQVDGGPGHRDYLTLPLQKGRVNLDEVVINPGSGEGLNWALAPALVGMVGVMVRVRSRRQQR